MFTRLSLKSGFLICAILWMCALSAHAQTPVPVRDPNAIALASKALQALAGGKALTDITFQATARLILGSDTEAGTATLVARNNNESLVTLSLSGGQRKEIRAGIQGVWVGTDGVPHATASHNCFLDPAWFFPALSLEALATDPTLSITLVGQETLSGEAVYHLHFSHVVVRKKPSTVALIQAISAMELYLDATTLEPVALAFNVHPDRDTNTNLAVEILYGAYQSFNGVLAPTRIQRYLQNTLVLDLTVANVAVNSGVSDSVFTLPAVPTGGGR